MGFGLLGPPTVLPEVALGSRKPTSIQEQRTPSRGLRG